MALQDWLKGLADKARDAVSQALLPPVPQRAPVLVPVARPRR